MSSNCCTCTCSTCSSVYKYLSLILSLSLSLSVFLSLLFFFFLSMLLYFFSSLSIFIYLLLSNSHYVLHYLNVNIALALYFSLKINQFLMRPGTQFFSDVLVLIVYFFLFSSLETRPTKLLFF